MKRLLFVVLLAGFFVPAFAQNTDAPRQARPEALPPEKFSEVHGELFNRAESTDAAELTDRIAGSLTPDAAAGSVPRRNFVDEHIFSKIELDAVPHAPLAGDIEFLRRVTLDLTGRIPSRSEVR